MSTPLSLHTSDAARKPLRPGLPAWMREPLLHFVVLGGLLFMADHLVSGRQHDPNRIVVSAATDHEIRQLFATSRGRQPTTAEFAALRQRWLDNEVLYREGLALQVDRGDSAIRDRVVFKALSLVDANLRRPALDDAVLRQWFEANRARYDEPRRFDFQEAVLPGESSESAVRQLVRSLNGGSAGDARAGLRVFKGRPLDNLVQSYGAEFAQAVETATPGEWRALPTQGGWRAIRVDALVPARPASFDALRGVIVQDWTDAVMAEQRTAAVRSLARKYTVIDEAAP